MSRVACAVGLVVFCLGAGSLALAAEVTDGSFEGAYDVTVPSDAKKNAISASSSFTSYVVAKAFDNGSITDSSSRFIVEIKTKPLPYWVQYQFKDGLARRICGYSLAMPDVSVDHVNRGPKEFVFSGSNDGTTWTTLGSETDITGWKKAVPRYFTCDDAVGYAYFRLTVSAVNDSTDYASLGEVEFYSHEVALKTVGEPAEYGTAAGVVYGDSRLYADGTAKTFSVAEFLSVDDQDPEIRYVPVSDGVRAVYRGYSFADAFGTAEGTDETFSRSIDGIRQDAAELVWKWRLRNHLSVTAAAGGGGGRVAVRYRIDKSSLTADCCNVNGAKQNKSNPEAANGRVGTVYWEPIRGIEDAVPVVRRGRGKE